MAEVIDLAAARAERRQRAQDTERQRLQEAARLLLTAAGLAGLAPTAGHSPIG